MNEKIKSSILGLFIGLAVIVPGFSGAQMAIIFKLYDKLMLALDKLFTKKSILFLLPVLLGAIVGFILGLFTIKVLLSLSVFIVTCVFAGMMVGSLKTITIELKTPTFKKRYILYFILGLIIPLIISTTSIYLDIDNSALLLNTPIYFYFVAILLGFLIALTQLIPGMSATALLLSFGLYHSLLNTINLDYWINNPSIIILYFMFAIGGIIGILSLSKLINKLLINYKTQFYYLIFGLCISNIINMFYNLDIINFFNNLDFIYLHIILGIILFVISAGIIYYITNITLNKESEYKK